MQIKSHFLITGGAPPLIGTLDCFFASEKFHLEPEKSSLVFHVYKLCVCVRIFLCLPYLNLDTNRNRKESKELLFRGAMVQMEFENS